MLLIPSNTEYLSDDQSHQNIVVLNNDQIDQSQSELDEKESDEILSSNSSIEDSADESYEEQSNENSDQAIYENSSVKISQFNLLLTLFISRFSLSKKCSKELLKLIVFLLPKPTKIKKSVETLYINNGVNKPIKKFVCSGCWVDKKSIDIHCENSSCIFSNKRNSLKESGLEILYLNSQQQLESILKREKSTILKYKTVIKFELF
jgi:hypothetical protein